MIKKPALATDKQVALLKKRGRSNECTPELTKARAWQMIRYSRSQKFDRLLPKAEKSKRIEALKRVESYFDKYPDKG